MEPTDWQSKITARAPSAQAGSGARGSRRGGPVGARPRWEARCLRVLPIIGALALVLLAVAQAGATTTIGANLSRVPDDAMVDCTTLPPYGVPTYASSCTWFSTISGSENDIVPEGYGVITLARVRVGAVTGPMQFAVGRAQLDRNKEPGHQLLCCVWRAAGPVFTPTPNSITTVTLNEPVLNVRDFQSNQDLFDNFALSVLQAGVPIPASRTASVTTSTAGACWPAVQLGNTYCAPGGPGNYAVLINADWEASGGVKLAALFAPVRNNAALVPLACQLAQECAGLLRLQNARAPGAAIAASRTVTYGSASFRISAGKTKTVKVNLGKAGRELLRKHKKVTVWANSTVGRGTAQRVTSVKLTLKR